MPFEIGRICSRSRCALRPDFHRGRSFRGSACRFHDGMWRWLRQELSS
jgi:hypothetical protein